MRQFENRAHEVLKNKDIDGAVATDENRITLPANTTTNLAANVRKAGTIAFDSTLGQIVIDNGSAMIVQPNATSTETLTNKTLTSPVISAPSITGVPTTTVGIGAKNGATVSAVENGEGIVHKTLLTLASTPVTVANVTGASFGGVKIYDFPEGRILILGTTANLSFNWHSTGISETGTGSVSLGTTITADATLATTEVNLLPSSAMTNPFVAGVGTATGALAASAQIDGTATAIDADLNIIIADAAVADGDSSIVLVSGTVTMHWINLGDY